MQFIYLKVGHLLLVKCPPSPHLPWLLAPLVKTHTKLPILTAHLYLAAGYRTGDHCEIRICG